MVIGGYLAFLFHLSRSLSISPCLISNNYEDYREPTGTNLAADSRVTRSIDISESRSI